MSDNSATEQNARISPAEMDTIKKEAERREAAVLSRWGKKHGGINALLIGVAAIVVVGAIGSLSFWFLGSTDLSTDAKITIINTFISVFFGSLLVLMICYLKLRAVLYVLGTFAVVAAVGLAFFGAFVWWATHS